jgi:translation elongation factor aEF-1 beta
MAQVVITLRIMQDSPDIDLKQLEAKASAAIKRFGGEIGKVDIQPVAFGLKALDIYFVMDEAKGSTEVLENEIANFDGIASVEITDVRRAIG